MVRMSCPERSVAPLLLPGVSAAHLTPQYWISRSADADRVWLDQQDLRDLNARWMDPHNGVPIFDLEHVDRDAINTAVKRRLTYLRQALASGEYQLSDRQQKILDSGGLSTEESASLNPSLFVAQTEIAIYCGPVPYRVIRAKDPLKLNRNLCSTARRNETLQTLERWSNGMQLARTHYVMGWIASDVPLSPPGPSDLLSPAEWPTRSLSRRRVIARAFELLNQPYGWGGENGGLDCSRFVMEVFRSFGLMLPRHSGQQARAAPYVIEVPRDATHRERLIMIDHAQRHGIVLLHMPGHIGIYLGRDHRNIPMMIHAFTEYAESCRPTFCRETRRQVHRVTVSTLSLGAGTQTGSFLGRVDRISTLGNNHSLLTQAR